MRQCLVSAALIIQDSLHTYNDLSIAGIIVQLNHVICYAYNRKQSRGQHGMYFCPFNRLRGVGPVGAYHCFQTSHPGLTASGLVFLLL